MCIYIYIYMYVIYTYTYIRMILIVIICVRISRSCHTIVQYINIAAAALPTSFSSACSSVI